MFIFVYKPQRMTTACCMKSFPVHRRQTQFVIIWSPVALLCSNHEWFLHTVPDRNEDNASPVLESALFFHAWHRTSLLHCLSTVSPIHTNTQCVCSVWLTECSIIRYTLAQFISIWSGYRDGQSIMFLKVLSI